MEQHATSLWAKVAHFMLVLAAVTVVEYLVERAIYFDVPETESTSEKVIHALNTFDPFELGKVFTGKVNVLEMPGYQACFKEKGRDKFDRVECERMTFTCVAQQGAATEAYRRNINSECYNAAQKQLQEELYEPVDLNGFLPRGSPATWLSGFVLGPSLAFYRTVKFQWLHGTPPTRFIILCQLMVGMSVTALFMGYAMKRMGIVWWLVPAVFVFGTIAASMVTAVPLKWLALYTWNTLASLYIVTGYRAVDQIAGGLGSLTLHSAFEKMFRSA
jgi:hypothetical protein